MDKLKRNKRAMILCLALLIAVFTVIAVGWQILSTTASTPTFQTEIARQGDITQEVIATGKIEVAHRVEVRAQASLLVQRVLVDVGDKVKAGQVLAVLDTKELQYQVEQAEARLQAAGWARRRDPVGAAEATLRFAAATYDRQAYLFEHGLVSRQLIESAQMEKRQAEITLTNAKAEESRLEADVREANATLELARQRLLKATVLSPIDGVVLARQAEPGIFTSAELNPTPLFTLGTGSSLRFIGEVDESEIRFLHPGMPVKVKVEEMPDQVIHGHLMMISPASLEKENFTRVEIRVGLDEGRRWLRDRATAKAEILIRQRANVVLIGEKSVQYRGNQPFVEVPDSTAPGGKRQVDVQLGLKNGIEVEVLSGLVAGEQVIYLQP